MLNRNIFSVYAADEIKYHISDKDSKDSHALKPVVKAIDNLFDNNIISEDIHNNYRVYIVHNLDLFDDIFTVNADDISIENTIGMLRYAIEDLSRDKEYNENYIIILRYETIEFKRITDDIRFAAENRFNFYMCEEEDIDETSDILFIYNNILGNKVYNQINANAVTKYTEDEQKPKTKQHSYYVSYYIGNTSLRTVIINTNSYISTPEDLEKIKRQIEVSEGIDPVHDPVTIIAFSLFHEEEQRVSMGSSHMTMYVFKITYNINGEEKELIQGVDVDILDPKYENDDLALSLVYDLDEVNDDDEVFIIDVERLGYGEAEDMMEQFS